jgi:hypothetical protein
MAFYLSPLVDVNEIDLSTTIPAVATSIGVILLRSTYKGAEGKKTYISNTDSLIRMFGEPTGASATDMLSAMGFLKFGRNLYCTRVMPTDATFAGITIDNTATSNQFDINDLDTDDNPIYTTFTLDDLVNEDPDDFGDNHPVTTLDDAFWFIASSRGNWGNNVRVAFLSREDQDALRKGTLTPDISTPAYYRFADIESNLSEDDQFLVIVESKEQGSNSWELQEVFNVSLDDHAIDDQGRTMYVENVINRQSDYVRVSLSEQFVTDNTDSEGVITFPTTMSNGEYHKLTAGFDGDLGNITDADLRKALDLYKNTEEIDVNIIIDSDKPIQHKRYMVEFCETRKDCMAIIDVPRELVYNNKGNEATEITDWRLAAGSYETSGDDFNQNTSYASVYGNWLEVYDQYSRKYRWIPSSGYVAGIYARTDDMTDPWWAPAGLNRAILTNIRRLAWNPSLGERDLLYKNGINPIVSFSGQGKVIWGQKTLLDKNSAFNRVNVRRLFMVLEKAISTAAKYFLFEPNDTATRNRMVSMINPFLRDVKARRGVYDFLVVADETINTPERIDRNELWCNIYIKPTRAAEYIVLNFVATRTGANFEEVAESLQ